MTRGPAIAVVAVCLAAAADCSRPEDRDPATLPAVPDASLAAAEDPPAAAGSDAAGEKAPKPAKAGGEIMAGVVPQETQNLYGIVEWSTANIYEKPDLLTERIGYFRAGTTILLGERVKPTNPKSPKCVTGWYKLLDGEGYICASKGFQIASVLLQMPEQINPPTTEELLPYRYGRVMVDFTPLYERLPSAEEEALVEKYAAEKKKAMLALQKEKELQAVEAQKEHLKTEILEEQKQSDHVTPEETGEAAGAPEAGTADEAKATETGAGEKPPEAGETGEAGEEGEEGEEEIPFDYVGAMLMRGFYLSIDSEVKWAGKRWYRTTRGKYIRFEPVLSVNPITAHGVQLKEGEGFPVGIVLRKNIFARMWNAAGTHLVKNKDIVFDKFFGFHIYKNVTDAGKVYHQIDEEGKTFILSWSVAILRKPHPRPPEIPEGSKWIHVDISDQALTAYEGDMPVFVTLVSSGNEKKDPAYMTPRGLYWIISKNVTATMANLALDEEAYWIEDVPWTMYFYKSYALHGAFWHNVFGNMRSHGCVNLTPADARWLFYWTDPVVPLGWHGVYSPKKGNGTPVLVTD